MKETDPIIIELLKGRGITEEQEQLEFLSEKPQKTYDPFLLDDMREGVDLILSAIEDDKRICIYGDYDADGITSVCILFEVLSQLTDDLEYYIPSRFQEGYGLNKEALKKLKDRGNDLIVTVDCGSTSFEEVEYAKELGLDILVTDHHNITYRIADCLMINPKREDSNYPFRELAGCGVAFKLAQGLQQIAGLPKSILSQVLDLVAIGTIGDIVSLTDENRTLAKYGIKMIKAGKRIGLKKLIEAISLSPAKINSHNVAYGIVPNLNATGRMKDARLGVELLLERTAKHNESDDRADVADDKKSELAAEVVECNKQRKTVQEEAYEKCVDIVEKKLKDDLFLIVQPDEIHEGIAGIVAGKLKEKYKKPVIVIMPSGDMFKGTGRSIGNVDLYETLRKFDYLFEKFGGHKGACGFSISGACLAELRENIDIEIQEQYAEDNDLFKEEEIIDMELDGGNVTLSFAKKLDLLEPFGCGNKEPRFLLKKVNIKEMHLMGNDGTHARFSAICRDGYRVDCLLFGRAKEFWHMLGDVGPSDVTGHIDWQEWRGNINVRFIADNIVRRK